MTYYMCATIIIVLLMITMILHVIKYSGFTKTQKTWYISTFSCIAFCALCEFAVHSGYYNIKFKIPLIILTILQFSISPLLSVFFSGALGMYKEARRGFYFFSINIVAESVLAPFGLIFFFDEAGYHRGDLFIIYEVFYFIGLLYLIIDMCFVGKRFRHRDLITIIMILFLLIFGIIPMTIDKIHVAYLSIGICSALCYIYYNDLVQQDIKDDLVANQNKIFEMQTHTISGLANLIENRDTETGGHVARTSEYVKILATDCKNKGLFSDIIDDNYIYSLYKLAPLHDVGKIVVSDTILKKPGKLTAEEYEEMKKHATFGGEVVKEILTGVTDEDYLKFASDIATYHHERFDGSGYPNKLKGDEIPLNARIMAIADVFDALISKRCYKEAIPIEEAFEIIKEESGTHFDPRLVDVFLSDKEKYVEIFKLKWN